VFPPPPDIIKEPTDILEEFPDSPMHNFQDGIDEIKGDTT
jgi:hypothetical protein